MEERAARIASGQLPRGSMLIVLFAALLLSAGCASESQMVTVTVRDRQTQQPIPGAWVQIRPLHLFSTEPPHAIVDPSPAAGGSAETGPDGTAKVQGVLNHPMDVHILAPDYVPLYFTVVIDSDPTDCPWHSSLLTEDEEDVLKRLEVQLRP